MRDGGRRRDDLKPLQTGEGGGVEPGLHGTHGRRLADRKKAAWPEKRAAAPSKRRIRMEAVRDRTIPMRLERGRGRCRKRSASCAEAGPRTNLKTEKVRPEAREKRRGANVRATQRRLRARREDAESKRGRSWGGGVQGKASRPINLFRLRSCVRESNCEKESVLVGRQMTTTGITRCVNGGAA